MGLTGYENKICGSEQYIRISYDNTALDLIAVVGFQANPVVQEADNEFAGMQIPVPHDRHRGWGGTLELETINSAATDLYDAIVARQLDRLQGLNIEILTVETYWDGTKRGWKYFGSMQVRVDEDGGKLKDAVKKSLKWRCMHRMPVSQ